MDLSVWGSTLVAAVAVIATFISIGLTRKGTIENGKLQENLRKDSNKINDDLLEETRKTRKLQEKVHAESTKYNDNILSLEKENIELRKYREAYDEKKELFLINQEMLGQFLELLNVIIAKYKTNYSNAIFNASEGDAPIKEYSVQQIIESGAYEQGLESVYFTGISECDLKEFSSVVNKYPKNYYFFEIKQKFEDLNNEIIEINKTDRIKVWEVDGLIGYIDDQIIDYKKDPILGTDKELLKYCDKKVKEIEELINKYSVLQVNIVN